MNFKHLGKKPPKVRAGYENKEKARVHYRQSLLEAADICEQSGHASFDVTDELRFKEIANMLRISAGAEP